LVFEEDGQVGFYHIPQVDGVTCHSEYRLNSWSIRSFKNIFIRD
jgi:hypothetical protein